MKYLIILLFVLGSTVLFSFLITSESNSFQNQNKYIQKIPEKGFVPDKATAIKIAEAIWLPIYGDRINDKKPFHANLVDSIWVVEGTLPKGYKGGVPYIAIQKRDCKILRVTHGK